ncbi:MAG TPA: tetratricopeptide repeat protein [Kiritimatiellia bacterium]|nr:tetratricopeptide repeat protein [Kiritimatiellia bacterium]
MSRRKHQRLLCAACAGIFLAFVPARAVDPVDQLQFADGLFARGLYDLAVNEYRAVAGGTNASNAALATYRIGEARRTQGDAAAARVAYAETVERFPGQPVSLRARFRIAEDDVQAGRNKEAAAELKLLADHDGLPPDLRASTLYFLATAHRRLNQNRDAESVLRRLLKAAPDSAHAALARVDLAHLRIDAGAKPDEIRSLLEDAAAQTNYPRAAAEALITLGGHAFREGRFDESAGAYARYLDRHPDDPQSESVRLSAAWAFLKDNRVDRALALAKRKDTPRDAAWLYLRANAERTKPDLVAARGSYEALLKQFPKAREAGAAAFELALLLVQAGDFSNAYTRAREVPLTDENRDDLLWLLAETARETGRAEEALQLYDEAAAGKGATDRELGARFHAARIRQQAGEWEDASVRYRAIAALAPRHRLAADSLFASAFCQTQRAAHEEAIKDWKALLKNDDRYPALDQVYFGMAQAELALERNEPAGASLLELLKRFPGSALAAEAHLLYGSLLEQQEQFDVAEFHYAQALRKKPDPALARRIQFRRLAVLQRQGRSGEAAASLDQLIRDGAAADIPILLLDWAARWNLENTNHQQAVTAARAMAEQRVSPGWDQVAHYLAGRAFSSLDQPDEAGAAFARSAQADASTAEGLEAAWRWGEWAVNAGRWDEAQRAFDLAATRASTPETAEIRARSYYGLGRVAEGREQWMDAARQYMAVAVLYDDPVLTPQALRAAARMFERAGQPAAAAQALRELKERHPHASGEAEPNR